MNFRIYSKYSFRAYFETLNNFVFVITYYYYANPFQIEKSGPNKLHFYHLSP